MAHDALSPSSAHCWLKCPGAPALIDSLHLPDEVSVYAREGTQAHKEAEKAADAIFEGEAYQPGTADEAMADYARGWAVALRDTVGSEPLFVATEYGLDISPITKRAGARGTADFVAITEDGVLLIADFKYGMGVEVEVERNPQLTIYALAALEALDGIFCPIAAVELMIYQPRMHAKPATYLWDMDELMRYRRYLIQVAKLAGSLIGQPVDPATLRPGEDQCRFCRAKGVCPALRSKVKAEIVADFDVIKAPTPLAVPDTDEGLAKALPWLDTIRRWCDAVQESATARLFSGEPVPGYKLVAGRKGLRRWTEGAEDALRAMRIKKGVLYKETLISPAQVEKLRKTGDIGPKQWSKIQEFITQADGKPVIAPESDKRPALETVKDEFEVLDGNQEK